MTKKSKSKRFTDNQIDFLKVNYQHMSGRQLTAAFNAHFCENRSHTSIRSALVNHKIKANRPNIQPLRLYTAEQIHYLEEGYKKYNINKLTKKFNAEFETNKTEKQIYAAIKNRKFQSGRTGQFKKGAVPWNQGKAGYMGPNKTSFKPGNKPHNTKWLYYERVGKHGVIEISVPEENPYTGFPRRFKAKHVWLWEQHNGPVPDGHIVAFKDGDHRNIAIENLMLLSRTELLRLNQKRYKQAPEEVKPVLVTLAKIEAKMSQVRQRGREKS